MMATDDKVMEATREAVEIIEAASRLLAGRDPGVQGAVLADLTALWIAGHIAVDPGERDKVREDMLAFHMEEVRRLIPINVERIIEPKMRRRTR